MYKRWIASVMLMMSIVLAACGADEITAESIVQKMRETQAATNDLHSVVTLSFSSPDESGSIKAELWSRKTGQKAENGDDISAFRAKILESSEGDMAGTELVFNGAEGWVYNPAENIAIVGTADELEALEDEAGKGQSSGPASQMEMFAELQEVIAQGLEAVDLEILGEEQIAGHNAYKLKITPKKEMQEQLQLPVELLFETTLWVDSERWLPLKLVIDAKDMGKVEIVADPLDTNTNLDPAIFEADPPAGATIKPLADLVKEIKESGPQAMTLDEAQTKAGFTIMTATETGGTALVDVQLVEMPQGTTVVQTFAGAGMQWSLVQTKGDFPEREQGTDSSKEIDVRGVKGKLVESNSSVGTILMWEENGVSIVMAGDLTTDEALKIAESLK